MLLLEADGRVEDVPGGPAMAAVGIPSRGRVVGCPRARAMFGNKMRGTPVFRKRPGPPESTVSEVLASNPDVCPLQSEPCLVRRRRGPPDLASFHFRFQTISNSGLQEIDPRLSL